MQKMYVANKAILVNPEGKILLVRDAGKGDHAGAEGRWDFPGGRMDKGERPKDCLVREVLEEAGITVDASHARPIHVGKWGVGGDTVNEPIIGIFWMVPTTDTNVKLSDEHTEFAWVHPDEKIDMSSGNESFQDIITALKEVMVRA